MIVTSHFVAEKLKSYSGRDATVIHPVLPVIPESFIPSSSKESNTGLDSRLRGNDGDRDDGKVLLFTHGRLESGKGIETVISVWKSLEADVQTQ